MARLWLLEDVLDAARAEDNLARRRRRAAVRLQHPPLNIEHDFMALYRLTPALYEDLLADLGPLLGQPMRRDAIPTASKVLTALAFFASGSYQRLVGQNIDAPMAQQTVSQNVRKVTEALNNPDILRKYIKFPQDRLEREKIKLQFFAQFNIPGVIGCIDCSHVAIIKPKEHEERYFNRKYYHSLNVQTICDKNMQILSVDASYGGSSHDSFIFNHHELKNHLQLLNEAGESTWLLGDSGYPQRPYMMTPILDAPEGSAEAHYNSVQMSTRNTIERTFGLLKARWRCLLAARELHYDPITASKIINACCVLHNLCNSARVPPLNLTPEELEEEAQRQEAAFRIHAEAGAQGAARDGDLHRGREARALLVRNLQRLRN